MQLQAILFVAAWLIAAFVHSQQQGCMLNDAELLKQRRLRNLKTNILAQLGISEPELQQNVTATPSPAPAEDEAVLETFEALRNASASLEKEKERKCSSEDFFAKPVTSFVGLMQPEGV